MHCPKYNSNNIVKNGRTHLPGIHVIHLIRQKLLQWLISNKVAMQTKQWLIEKSLKTKSVEVAPFKIKMEDYNTFFENVFAWQK